ncbi:MAG: serine protease [Chloroflexi bacterium]|nr:serine protease [Chloroflexota bacterium]
MEVIHGIRDNRLFLVLHSPGGSSEAAESIVNYLRSKFRRIEAVVPHQAKSAASMLACAADRIWMARHSELGPIDPQFILQTPLGWRAVPAQSILNQFKKAAAAIMNDQAAAVLWYPMLSQYGPGLLDEAEKAVELSEVLVGSWLSSYMFRRRKHGNDLAKGIARFLSDYDEHKTHGRPLGYSVLKERGLIVRLIEQDQALQDRVLTVYHAAMHAFANTPAAKIILNHQGSAAVRLLSS